jgi:hypothetical protein
MFIKADKIKRDYEVSYEYAVAETCVLYNKVFCAKVTDCYNSYQAFEAVVDKVEQDGYRIRDWYVQPVVKTHRDFVNEQVYNLVLAELFDGDIGINVYIDENEDDVELHPELEGLEKMLVEHQAQLKFDSKR